MSEGTSGKWVVFAYENVTEVQDENGQAIIGWPGFDDAFRPPSEHRANARLAAAAGTAASKVEKHGYGRQSAIEALPDLIRACEYALEQIEGLEDVFDYLDLELRAALGSARGSAD
jgi:hypothetical protein